MVPVARDPYAVRMTGSSIAGIITAVATVLIATGGVITAVGVLLPILRGTREIHTLVNQAATDARRYNERLIEALVAAGVPVPRDSSLRAPDGGPAA